MEPVRPRFDEAPEPFSGSTVDRLLTLSEAPPPEHTRVIDDFIHLAHTVPQLPGTGMQFPAQSRVAWSEWTFVAMALVVLSGCALAFTYFIYGEFH